MEEQEMIESRDMNNLAAKIKNIEGRIQMPVRKVSFVQPLNDTIKNKAAVEGKGKGIESDQPKTSNSYVSTLKNKQVNKVVKVTELRNDELVDGAAVAIPFEAVEEVSSRFTNTLYGYFIGKRLAFRLVENYVKNTWAKYGLKLVQLHEDFFLFQFETKEGMDSVLENSPWLIRMVPLILNVWCPNTDLKKAEVKKAPVWMKLHHVPIVAYSEVGLSLIAAQLGKPIMMDSYTSNMCVSSWGRSTYARILIEVSADADLKESLVIAIPVGRDKGLLSKPPPKLQYRRVEKKVEKGKSSNGAEQQAKVIPNPISKPKVTLTNSFSSLDQNDTFDDPLSQTTNTENEVLNCSDSEVDEILKMEEREQALLLTWFPIINLATWNIQGLNFSPKQMEVKQVIAENSLSVCAILESHVVDSNLQRLCSQIFRHWDWSSNGAFCDKGTRIILGWNHNDVDVAVSNQDDQSIHTRIWLKKDKKELFCSFIYAHNRLTRIFYTLF
nr:hypothetical protein [Tanacetum cinerariifolium]